MEFTANSIIFLMIGSWFCAYLLVYLVKFLHRSWWVPIRVQNRMRSQGIDGPSYRFMFGNSKEVLEMTNKSLDRPTEGLHNNIGPKIQPHIFSWIQKYGETFVYWVGSEAQVITTDLKIIKEVMNDKDGVFPKSNFDEYIEVLLGDGLVMSNGKKWMKIRKLANHAFYAESLRNMVPAMVSSVEVMLERWKGHKEKEMEVHEEFKLLTSEIISITAFGSSYVEGKDIFENFSKLILLMLRNSLKIRLPFLKTHEDVELNKFDRVIRESIVRIIKKREKESEGGVDGFGKDYLGLLMKANHMIDDGYQVTIEDIVDECKSFYIAGHETTTSLLTWLVFLLAIHTNWQEKARDEVFKLFGDKNPTSDGLPRMKTVNMIIHETLRLYPPVGSLVRKSKRETIVGNFKLPSNVVVHIPVVSVHHNTEIWGKDAHEFNPERFSEGVAKATNNNPMVFIPFGFGPRSCVGLNFAINEAKITLSMILQRYTFTLSPTYIHSPFIILTIIPKFGVPVFLHPL